MTVIDGKAGGDHHELHVFMSELEDSRYQSTFHLMVTILVREGSQPGSRCLEVAAMTNDSSTISKDVKEKKRFAF